MKEIMKKIFVILFISIYLVSCTNNNIESEKTKKDFFVEVKSLGEFSDKNLIKKTGKLNSKQDLKIVSNATGRVKNILVKEGDYVNTGEILAQLEDNIANYSINLEKAKNALSRSKINYDSNKISLDKQVFDSELNLKKLRNNLQALKDNTTENIRQAETNLDNADYDNLDSKSALELQKFDNSITKAELDYENTKIANSETLESYYSTIKKEHNALLTLMDDIIQFSDQILGVTIENKSDNDSFQSFLGAKDTSQKYESENNLKVLINYRDNEFESILINEIDTGNKLVETLLVFTEGYIYSKDILNSLEETLNNSISSVGAFDQSTIDSYISSINIYQTTLQGNLSGFIGFESGVNSFLRTYLNSEESIFKSINLLKKDREILKKSLSTDSESAEVGYNKTIINSNDAIDTLELQIISAENTYENAQKTRDVSIRSLNNNINEANISYKQALKEYAKLNITSPISGVINDVFVDLGQEVSNGTPAFNISNTSSNEISISFNKKELGYVNEGKIVQIKFEDITYTGSINSIAKVADSNLKYLSKISMSDSNNITGNIVSILIPVEVENILLPINIVKIKASGYGTINILKDNQIEQLDIKLGNIYSDSIEVLSEIDSSTQVILNYIDNFDPEKFNLKIQ